MLAKKWEARRRNGRLGVVPHRRRARLATLVASHDQITSHAVIAQ
jgi:hypothetical protein